jgi:peptide chain release factor 1
MATIPEERLRSLEEKFEGLAAELSDPSIVSDQKRYQATTKAYSDMTPVVEASRKRRRLEQDLASARSLLADASGDPEMQEMARAEIARLGTQLESIDAELQVLLTPRDPRDEKDVILEIRAGTGGDEATLFAAELLRMYLRYCEARGWKASVLSHGESSVGGVKEAIVEIEGRGAYSRLKHESGVHRVQRVPATEAQGRIHTSAASVAVLPEAEEVDVVIPDKEIRIDLFCSSGAGGQSVNTTYSAVRLVHLPTGIVVQCQDERSQQKNRERAMKVLRARIQELREREQQEAIAAERKGMVGSGDRSEKIRTYNFPQDRVTDHRVPVTLHDIKTLMTGDLDGLLDAVTAHFQAEKLQES